MWGGRFRLPSATESQPPKPVRVRRPQCSTARFQCFGRGGARQAPPYPDSADSRGSEHELHDQLKHSRRPSAVAVIVGEPFTMPSGVVGYELKFSVVFMLVKLAW